MIESVKLVGFGALETDLVNSFPAIGKYSVGFLLCKTTSHDGSLPNSTDFVFVFVSCVSLQRSKLKIWKKYSQTTPHNGSCPIRSSLLIFPDLFLFSHALSWLHLDASNQLLLKRTNKSHFSVFLSKWNKHTLYLCGT